MTPPEAIIFDLDGTLVDSARDLQAAVNAVLSEENLRPLDLDEIKSMIGDGAAMLVKRAIAATGGDMTRLPMLIRRFLAVYEANSSHHTRTYPGVPKVLEDLRRSGLSLAVVTNKPYGPTIDILETLELREFFETVIGGDTLPERKPHPAPIRLALERLGAAPSKALLVGDNYHDVAAARAAGVFAVAVTYGYSHRPHAELGADRLIDHISELLPIIESATMAVPAHHTAGEPDKGQG